jgi:hypothetical protein
MPRLGQARKARLSIPKVQRPKRPGQRQQPALGRNRSAYSPRAGLAQRVVAPPSPASRATTQAQPSNAATLQTESTPTAPLSEASKAPAAPPAPKGLFDLPAYSGGEDPRDATYWANVSKLKFSAEQDYSKGLLEQQMADTGYNDALQTAIRNRATQQRGLGENAIRGNLSASGWLDRNEAEDTTAYTQDRAYAQLTKSQEDAGREAARKAILQGYSLDAAAELAEAASRYAQRKQEEAENAEALAGGEGGEGGGGSGGGGASGYTGTGGYIKPFKPKKKNIGVGPGKPAASPTKMALANKKKAK